MSSTTMSRREQAFLWIVESVIAAGAFVAWWFLL